MRSKKDPKLLRVVMDGMYKRGHAGVFNKLYQKMMGKSELDGCTVLTSVALMHFCVLTRIQKTITYPKSQHIVCDTLMVYTRSIYETLL